MMVSCCLVTGDVGRPVIGKMPYLEMKDEVFKNMTIKCVVTYPHIPIVSSFPLHADSIQILASSFCTRKSRRQDFLKAFGTSKKKRSK